MEKKFLLFQYVEIPIVGRETCQADYEGINGVDEGKPQMEFLNSIFSRGFRASRVFSDTSSWLFFFPHFSVLQNTVHE
jgi:hypothetical protein